MKEIRRFLFSQHFLIQQIEDAKIHCAREHFKAISGDNVVYDVVNSYEALLSKVMK